MTFDYMATLAAVIYCLGIYLHYIHVQTVFYLTENDKGVDNKKAIFHSILWPKTVLFFIWADITGAEYEEYDDDE